MSNNMKHDEHCTHECVRIYSSGIPKNQNRFWFEAIRQQCNCNAQHLNWWLDIAGGWIYSTIFFSLFRLRLSVAVKMSLNFSFTLWIENYSSSGSLLLLLIWYLRVRLYVWVMCACVAFEWQKSFDCVFDRQQPSATAVKMSPRTFSLFHSKFSRTFCVLNKFFVTGLWRHCRRLNLFSIQSMVSDWINDANGMYVTFSSRLKLSFLSFPLTLLSLRLLSPKAIFPSFGFARTTSPNQVTKYSNAFKIMQKWNQRTLFDIQMKTNERFFFKNCFLHFVGSNDRKLSIFF